MEKGRGNWEEDLSTEAAVGTENGYNNQIEGNCKCLRTSVPIERSIEMPKKWITYVWDKKTKHNENKQNIYTGLFPIIHSQKNLLIFYKEYMVKEECIRGYTS